MYLHNFVDNTVDLNSNRWSIQIYLFKIMNHNIQNILLNSQILWTKCYSSNTMSVMKYWIKIIAFKFIFSLDYLMAAKYFIPYE